MNRAKRVVTSPALWISMAALAVATGGTAIAATVITGAQIKAGTITSRNIRDRSLGVVDLAPKARATLKGQTGATTGPAGAAGPAGPAGAAGVPGASATALWAVVNAAGTLARGATGVSSVYSGASFYTVTFPRDVTACAYIATIGGTAGSYGGNGEISTYSSPVGPSSVTVVTHSTSGVFTDKPFHLAVFC